jgi:hypothetical protein
MLLLEELVSVGEIALGGTAVSNESAMLMTSESPSIASSVIHSQKLTENRHLHVAITAGPEREVRKNEVGRAEVCCVSR